MPKSRSSLKIAASCSQDHPRRKSQSCRSHRYEGVQHPARQFGPVAGCPVQAQASAELLCDPRDIPTSLSAIFPSRREGVTEASPSPQLRKRCREQKQPLLRDQFASRARVAATEPGSPYVSKSAFCPSGPILCGAHNMHGTAGRSCEPIVHNRTFIAQRLLDWSGRDEGKIRGPDPWPMPALI